MGDWDCLCAFCAGPFGCNEPFEDEEGGGFNPALITEEDLEWTEKFQVIGFNPDSFSTSKCFVTGPAQGMEYGSMDCEIGDDPNVPSLKYGTSDTDRVVLTTYSSYDPDVPLSVPFHTDCFEIFARALTYSLKGKVSSGVDLSIVDKDLLFAAMAKLHKGYAHVLSLSYGELQRSAREQYWGNNPGHEAWVSNPFKSPQLSSYFDSLASQPVLQPDSSDEPARHGSSLSATQPFVGLPKEVTCEILLNLSYTDLQHFTLSGLVPFTLRSIPSFWKRKLFLDMPFLFDFPSLSGSQDWFQLYRELKRHCFATTPATEDDEEGREHVIVGRDTSLVLGLANRRRVWDTCMHLAGLYEVELNDQTQTGETIAEEIRKGSVSLGMPLVATPVSRDAKALCTYLVSSWEDLNEDMVMQFYFLEEDDGRLCGICVEGQSVFGQSSQHSVDVVIKSGNWVQGFELNVSGAGDLSNKAKIGITGVKVLFQDGGETQAGAFDGDKRLTTASEGMVTTGLNGELAGGNIQRFGILQCPQGITASPLTKQPTLQRHMWKSALPPPTLQASAYKTGYWTPARSFDTISMEALVFGTTTTELSNITGFSSDAKMRSFGVHFQDGSSRYIGPRDANEGADKVFKIDGPGGEYVVKVEVGMNQLPMAIKLTTNKNRIAFFGHTQKNAHHIFEPGEKRFVAGIYASWAYNETARLCTTLSILSAAKEGKVNKEVKSTSMGASWSPPDVPSGRSAPDIAVASEKDYEKYRNMYW